MKINELTQEDKELIAKIDERLKQLGLITDNKYPDEEPNPEVIKFYDRYFKKADNEQQSPVEWKVGEWAKKENGYIGIITSISHYTLEVDPQDGMNNEDYMGMAEAIKPTKEEIEQHLVKIAKEKYPIGTKVKEVGTDVEYTVTHDGYRYVKSLNDLSFISLEEEWDKGHSNPTIWQNGVWAEPITKQKERWKIEVYQPNITGDEGFKIHIEPTFKLRKPLAEQAAQAIRETLENL